MPSTAMCSKQLFEASSVTREVHPDKSGKISKKLFDVSSELSLAHLPRLPGKQCSLLLDTSSTLRSTQAPKVSGRWSN